MLVGDPEARLVAIDTRLMRESDRRTRAEKVELFEIDARGVLAAAAPEVEARIQRPHIACRHPQVDFPIVVAHGLDPRVVEVTLGPEDALRFIEHPARVAVA